jgi:hypothetical protein
LAKNHTAAKIEAEYQQRRSEVFFNAMALLLLFCCSITGAVRCWLKTQAAA